MAIKYRSLIALLIGIAIGLAFGLAQRAEVRVAAPAPISMPAAPLPAVVPDCPVCSRQKPGQPPIPPSLVLDLVRECRAGALNFDEPDFTVRRRAP